MTGGYLAWWRCAWLGLILTMGMLVGCMTPAPVSNQASSQAFSRVGRFALTITSDDARQEGVQGGFAWWDDGRSYTLNLTNPLGVTQARVTGAPGSAVLTQANGTSLRARNPDDLLVQALGTRIPVSGLRDWLRGRLSEASLAQAVQRDGGQRLRVFTQGGWEAQLSRYDAIGPQLLILSRQEPGRRIFLRLIVHSG